LGIGGSTIVPWRSYLSTHIVFLEFGKGLEKSENFIWERSWWSELVMPSYIRVSTYGENFKFLNMF